MPRKWVVISSLAALAILIGLSVAVGATVTTTPSVVIAPRATAVSEPGGFNWELAALVLTGLGTTALAIATGALAYSTWSDVRASQRIAEDTRTQAEPVRRATELAESERDERLRPVIVGSVVAVADDSEGGYLGVELYNIGGGAAVRIDVRAESIVVGEGSVAFAPKQMPWLAAGGTLSLLIRAVDGRLLERELDEFRVRGSCLARLSTLPIIDWRHDELAPSA